MINFFKKKQKNKSLESFIFSYKSEENILNNLCKKYGCDKGYFEGSKSSFHGILIVILIFITFYFLIKD